MAEQRPGLLRIVQALVVLGIAIFGIATTEGAWRTVYLVLLVFTALLMAAFLGMLWYLPRFLQGQAARSARQMTDEQLRARVLGHAVFDQAGQGRKLRDVGQVRIVLGLVRDGRAHEALRKVNDEYDGIVPFIDQARRVVGLEGGAEQPHLDLTACLEELARRDAG